MDPAMITAMMEEYKVLLEDERRLSPESAPHMPRSTLMSAQQKLRESCEQEVRAMEEGSSIVTREMFVGFPKHFSTTPIEQLEPITISKMLARKTHVGRYLLCRFIAPCANLVCVQTVAEDHEGTAFNISVYNFPTSLHCSPDDLDALFPIEMVVAICEPTFKNPNYGEIPFIRVDSPTDLVIVDSRRHQDFGISRWSIGPRVSKTLSTPSTVGDWKERGDTLFKASRWLPAALAYSYGLSLDPDATVLYLNRSEAYLRLKFCSGALADVRRVLSAHGVSDAFRKKALVSEGKAEYARGNYQDAERMFAAWCQMHPDDKEIPTWIARCQQRSRESRTGDYNLAHLLKVSLKEPHLDVADYQGPIEVRRVEGRGGGRGVVATRDIKVGELLLASKPFVCIYAQDLPETYKVMVAPNMLTLRMDKRTQIEIATIAHVMQRIYGNPELHAHVFHLYGGPDYSPPPALYPPAIPQEPIPVNILSPNIDINVERIEAICSYNNFSPIPLRPHDIAPTGQAQSASDAHLDEASGLYLLPSLFNHDCAGNAIWHCIGDVMVVRAMRSIRAGEAITIPYALDFSYGNRAESLRNYLPNDCDCRWCTEDRKDEARVRWAGELTEEKLHQSSLGRLRSLETQVAATYPSPGKTGRPLIALATLQHAIVDKLGMQKDPRALKEAVAMDERALQSLGFVLLETFGGMSSASTNSLELQIAADSIPYGMPYSTPIFFIFRMVRNLLNLKDEAHAVRWLKTSLWILNMMVGGGKDFFLALLGPTLQDLDQWVKRVL